jgi:UDP-glucose 4-epimerase
MTRALITGVSGFIGQHLARHLVAEGWDVAGCDHHPLPPGSPAIDFRQCDVREAGLGKLDAIFHLAAIVGPADVVRLRFRMMTEHADDAAYLCSLAMYAGCPIVFTSSSEVYGANTSPPFREDVDESVIGPSCHPRWGYAVSKLAMEHVALASHAEGGAQAIIARLFNCVGSGQRHAFVLPIFARAALKGEPITIHGTGQQERCFTHVSDTVRALLALAETPEAVGQVVNVGATEPRLSMRSAALRIQLDVMERYGVLPQGVNHIPWEETGDLAWQRMQCRVPDTTKLQRLTGLSFVDRWEDIVRDVVDDQARQLGMEKRRAA